MSEADVWLVSGCLAANLSGRVLPVISSNQHHFHGLFCRFYAQIGPMASLFLDYNRLQVDVPRPGISTSWRVGGAAASLSFLLQYAISDTGQAAFFRSQAAWPVSRRDGLPWASGSTAGHCDSVNGSYVTVRVAAADHPRVEWPGVKFGCTAPAGASRPPEFASLGFCISEPDKTALPWPVIV